ncbi:MAG: 50S ribosomal protein L3 N(5)-glutamine methyltransferase [bacterium]
MAFKQPESGSLNTLIDYMRWGASQFVAANLEFSHGLASPLDESVYLVLRTLGLPVDTPEIYWHSRLTEPEKNKVLGMLRRRIEERIPAAYLMKEGWFAGLQFYIDERVLIPRSPIAELVEQQFTPWVNPDEVESVLDLCTGSGCIGIACAYAFPQAEVDLADISDDALEVAQINVKRHDAVNRVNVVHSDLFSGLGGKRYDMIVCNPPYVDDEDMQALPDEFKHEPTMALHSGSDGLDLTKKILHQAATHLNEEGVLVLEVGNSQYHLLNTYPDVPFQWLDFERGGDGVFLLTRQQLAEWFG